jgi:5-methylcytosine-specific restriction enzyme A
MDNDVPQRPAGTSAPEQRPVEGGKRYVRSPEVAAWALKRAAGRCELCLAEAPFRRAGGGPFLEVHHIAWLAKGGSDTPLNTAGVCPNCHRRLHHGHDAGDCASRLGATIGAKEAAIKG